MVLADAEAYVRTVLASGPVAGAPQGEVVAAVAAACADRDGFTLANVAASFSVPVPPRELAGEIAVGAVREALLPPGKRRALGAHFTPASVARRLCSEAVELCSTPPRSICDPAAGSAAFLIAAGDELVARGLTKAEAVERLWGADIDSVSVLAAQASLQLWVGSPVDGLSERIIVADPLTSTTAIWPGELRFDMVVGNPPFLNQLDRVSTRSRDTSKALADRFGRAAVGYVDTSALFILVALGLLGPGGVAVLIQPQSVLSARDAQAVREAADERASFDGLWFSRERIFKADVRVCAPFLRKLPEVDKVGELDAVDGVDVAGPGAGKSCPAGVSQTTLRRWVDRDVRPAPPATRSGIAGDWVTCAADLMGVPALSIPWAWTLADLGCRATAGFRDQFYGFVGAVFERGDRPDLTARLMTTGMIEPLESYWGRGGYRFAGTVYREPVIDVTRLAPSLQSWVQARAGVKVLVATQTRIVECVVDRQGCYVPATPVISVDAPTGLEWHVAAVLTSPVAAAVAMQRTVGAALTADAIKLSAKQVLALPVPSSEHHWDAAAALAREISEPDAATSPRRHVLLRELADRMALAYGIDDADLTEWWSARLRGAPRDGRRSPPTVPRPAGAVNARPAPSPSGR